MNEIMLFLNTILLLVFVVGMIFWTSRVEEKMLQQFAALHACVNEIRRYVKAPEFTPDQIRALKLAIGIEKAVQDLYVYYDGRVQWVRVSDSFSFQKGPDDAVTARDDFKALLDMIHGLRALDEKIRGRD